MKSFINNIVGALRPRPTPNGMNKYNEKLIVLIGLIFSFQLIFPQYAVAYNGNLKQYAVEQSMLNRLNLPQPVLAAAENDNQVGLPQSADRQPTRKLVVAVTAYSSTPDQTDDSPFITANGKHVKDGIVATNLLPFGTKVKFPELYGDRVFSVEDRMNAKYKTNFDIWMETRVAAQKFGIHFVTIEIY